MKETKIMLWDFIVDNGIATDDECQLVIAINEFSEETMMDIIFARTGLRSIEQCNDEGCYYLSEELLERYGLNEDEEDEEEEDED